MINESVTKFGKLQQKRCNEITEVGDEHNCFLLEKLTPPQGSR